MYKHRSGAYLTLISGSRELDDNAEIKRCPGASKKRGGWADLDYRATGPPISRQRDREGACPRPKRGCVDRV